MTKHDFFAVTAKEACLCNVTWDFPIFSVLFELV